MTHPMYGMISLRIRVILPHAPALPRLGAFAMGSIPRVDGVTVRRLRRPIRHSSQASGCRPGSPPSSCPPPFTSWGRVGTVDPFRYGVPPSPNRACTFQRTRLSILVFTATYLVIVSIRMTPFGLGHKDCLSSPQRLAFAHVTTAYTLADPEDSGCSTHDRQTLGTIETPSPYRWGD